MSKEIKRNMTELDLINHIRRIRLNAAKDYFLTQLHKGDKPEDDNAWKKIEAFFNRQNAKMHKYEERQANVEVALAHVDSEYPEPFTDAEALDYAETLFGEGEKEINKLLFAIKVIMDSEIPYEKEKDGLKEASRFLYNDPDKLSNLRKKLLDYYKDIAYKELGDEEKIALVALAGIGLVATFAIAPIGIPAAAATVGAQIGAVSAIVTAGVALTCMFVQGGYYLLDESNKRLAKEEFLSFNPEKQALTLAMELLIVDEMKHSLGEEEFKQRLDAILKTLAEFKGDVDYLLFVEKQNTNANRSKLTQFHRFDKKMVQILC